MTEDMSRWAGRTALVTGGLNGIGRAVEDLARGARFVVCSPSHVQSHDLLVRPTEQPS